MKPKRSRVHKNAGWISVFLRMRLPNGSTAWTFALDEGCCNGTGIAKIQRCLSPLGAVVPLATGMEEGDTMDEQQRLLEIENRLEEIAATIAQLAETLEQLRQELERKRTRQKSAR